MTFETSFWKTCSTSWLFRKKYYVISCSSESRMGRLLLVVELCSMTTSNDSSSLLLSPFFLHCQLKFWHFWNLVCCLWPDKNISSCGSLWIQLFSERRFTRFPGNFCNIFSLNLHTGTVKKMPLQQVCALKYIICHLQGQFFFFLNGPTVSQAICFKDWSVVVIQVQQYSTFH